MTESSRSGLTSIHAFDAELEDPASPHSRQFRQLAIQGKPNSTSETARHVTRPGNQCTGKRDGTEFIPPYSARSAAKRSMTEIPSAKDKNLGKS